MIAALEIRERKTAGATRARQSDEARRCGIDAALQIEALSAGLTGAVPAPRGRPRSRCVVSKKPSGQPFLRDASAPSARDPWKTFHLSLTHLPAASAAFTAV